MGLFEDKKNTNKIDEDLDKYNLEEWQKEEVRKGFQDPWSFEDKNEEEQEDELEEEDYYYEDNRSK